MCGDLNGARRWLNLSEVANMALFSASALASYVTGATLPVDGGLTFYPLSAILDA